MCDSVVTIRNDIKVRFCDQSVVRQLQLIIHIKFCIISRPEQHHRSTHSYLSFAIFPGMRMRYTSLIFVPLVLADVEFLSINLKGWQGCNNAQSAKISAAWENAVRMAAAVKDNVDLNEAASVEYFGPPVFSEDYKDEIRGVFSNAATFSQGSKWTPTPFKWDAYVRCDNWKGNCNTRGVAAYNVNKIGTPEGKDAKSDDERERSTPVMNFCPMWFRLPSLTEKIALNRDENIRFKYDLESYASNRGMSHPEISFKSN
jgi:hypothetical protein